jgi:transcriptional regulator with XRE-family HTH domain
MQNIINLDELGQPAAKLFGKRLKARRQALKLTQAQLFRKTAITGAYISLIEQGRANPTLDMMIKLAHAVGLEAWAMIRPDDTSV